MSIYKLKKEEVVSAHNEFNNTDYGKRAKVFSVLPIICGFIWLILLIIYIIENSEDSIFALTLILGMATLNFSVGCITQLQYGKMLKEYVESKK